MSEFRHASAVVIGDKGVLVLGDSGAGKSSLVRHLMDYARMRGRYAALIGDDRIKLTRANGRLLAEGHPKTAGLLEIRGLGLVTTNFIQTAVIDLLVSAETVIKTRLPDGGERSETFLGICVPRIETRPDDPEPVWIALGFGHLTVQH